MSLFEERVEAGARVLRERLFPGVDLSFSGGSAWAAHVREVLLAADAVVTEEQIAEVLHAADCGCGLPVEHDEPYFTQAKAVHALFRGGAK